MQRLTGCIVHGVWTAQVALRPCPLKNAAMGTRPCNTDDSHVNSVYGRHNFDKTVSCYKPTIEGSQNTFTESFHTISRSGKMLTITQSCRLYTRLKVAQSLSSSGDAAPGTWRGTFTVSCHSCHSFNSHTRMMGCFIKKCKPSRELRCIGRHCKLRGRAQCTGRNWYWGD
jgi:hypothetical protein